MILLDSNIIIYAADSSRGGLRELFFRADSFVSEISLLEVLGYHKITQEETDFFQDVFLIMTILPISSGIIRKAIGLRKKYNLSTGDSIIASTALSHNLTLYTSNISDFKNIT